MAEIDAVEGEQTQKNTPDDENIVEDALEWGEVDSQAMLVALRNGKTVVRDSPDFG